MRDTTVDPATRIAIASGGATVHDVVSAAAAYDLSACRVDALRAICAEMGRLWRSMTMPSSSVEALSDTAPIRGSARKSLAGC
jgi:hypothetical protein